MKYEYKHPIPIELLPELRALIKPFVVCDRYMDKVGPCGYTVRSIYFDSFNYADYHETIEGIQLRKKIRIRGYNEYDPNSKVFLEIKRKNKYLRNKQRAPVEYRHLKDVLFTGDIDKYVICKKGSKTVLENAREFFFHIYRNSLQPMVLTIYEREAFFDRFDNSTRITFDKNLRSAGHPDIRELFHENNIRYSIPGFFVLEVKFYGVFPLWMKSILKSLGINRQKFSKYTNCMDEHNAMDIKLPSTII